jgi:hypothetical protein
MCAAKSTASHNYFAALLRSSLAVSLKQLGQEARVVQRVVHGVEQRQIAQLGTTVKIALRKDVATHHNCLRLTHLAAQCGILLPVFRALVFGLALCFG